MTFQGKVGMGRYEILAVGLIAACAASLAAGCTTERNPAYCDSDADCVDSVFPFCDLHGEYAESNHRQHTCTAVPAGCPVERCGCTPGAALSCDVDQLEVCDAGGRSSSSQACALGCAAGAQAEPRCLTFEPSNDLGGPLAAAAAEPDVILPPGARIDTDLGLVQDANGMPLAVRSVVIEQDGGTSIRVLMGRSFVIDAATVRGSRALAIVAPGPITLTGRLEARGIGGAAGPGAQEEPAVCAAQGFQQPFGAILPGSGGGGNATAGANGGGFGAPGSVGGVLIPTRATPLVGGCRGGTITISGTGTPQAIGGAGGGAVELVSFVGITLTDVGLIDVGGGGGASSAGGGSGGLVVLEAPSVRFVGAATGIAANGGAGGGCGSSGADGQPSVVPAAGPQCTNGGAGDGGTAIVTPRNGQLHCPGSVCNDFPPSKGGGGGAVGRLVITTREGNFDNTGTPLLSAKVIAELLVPR